MVNGLRRCDVSEEIAPMEAGAQALPRALYEQRRRVELLRQQVYAPADPVQ